MKKHFGIGFGLSCMAITGFLIAPKFFNSSGAAQEPKGKTPPPVVQVDLQPELPLKIVVTSIDSTNPSRPRIEYLLSNDGQRAVRAYTIRYSFTTAHSNFIAQDFQIIRSRNSFLQPGQTKMGEMSSSGSSEPVIEVKLSVDVVEFDDGEFLGPNLTRTREKISGIHAGVKAAVSFFQQNKEHSGPENLLESLKIGIDQEIINRFPPEKDKSAEWISGYQLGIASVRARLAKANKDYGVDELEKELDRAIGEVKGR